MTGASYDTDVVACRIRPDLAHAGRSRAGSPKCHAGRANRPNGGLAPPLLK
jgi:hypothetical protein